MSGKRLLRAVYVQRLATGAATIGAVSAALGLDPVEARAALGAASDAGEVEVAGEQVSLTPKGRAGIKVVMIGGAFEIIHPGHLHTISEARSHGDTLVVVVAADRTVAKNKGREPVTTQEWRVKLVGALRDVDVALPGGQGSIYDTLEKVRPDTVALGYDQKHNPQDIEAEAGKRGMTVKVVRMGSPIPGVKTSKIVNILGV
jgi:FAD synthetase